MKTKLTGITIPSNTNNATATFIRKGKMQTIPIPLSKIEDYLILKNYTYDECQHPTYMVYYNFQKPPQMLRDELIDEIIKGDDTTSWVVSEIFAPGMKII